VAGTFLTAVYVLRVARQIFWGPVVEPPGAHLADAEGPEWVSLVVLSAVLILFGLFPALAIAPIDTATVPLLDRLGVVR
jgi:NADH:ubiquinone oxidoreductase subunit 4 (subunit M)